MNNIIKKTINNSKQIDLKFFENLTPNSNFDELFETVLNKTCEIFRQEISDPLNEIFVLPQKKIFNLRQKIISLTNSKDTLVEKIQMLSKHLNLLLNSEEDLFFSYLGGVCTLFAKNLQVFFSLKKQNLTLFETIKILIDLKTYDASLTQYSSEELKLALEYIDFSYDFFNDLPASRHLLATFETYCLNKELNIFFSEFLQLLYLLNSLIICQNTPREERMEEVRSIYFILATKRISLATPTFSNLRTNNTTSYASCFIIKLEDNPISILKAITGSGMISCNTGGVGINISRIRSRQYSSTVSAAINVGKKVDVTSCTALFNLCSEVFGQSGKRTAATTISLDIWHADIQEFLWLNSETKLGDERYKAFDIFPQVIVQDEFMLRLQKNLDWYLFCPKEIFEKYNVHLDSLYGKEFSSFYNNLISEIENNTTQLKIFKVWKANDLYKLIVERQLESGLPYIFFKCTANEYNPNKNSGMIYSGNLCMESFSVISALQQDSEKQDIGLTHCCNLLSLNLSVMFSLSDIKDYSRIGNEILNRVLFLGRPPVESAVRHNETYRTVGLGALGFHDYLAAKKIQFTESHEETEKIFDTIAVGSIINSIERARKETPFKFFEGSEWDKGIIFGKTKEFYENSINKEDWQVIFNDLSKYGIYNSQLLAIAPNTSTSILTAATASVLPVYNTFFAEQNSKGIVFRISKFALYRKEFYVPYYQMDTDKVSDIISSIQKFVDQGISYELMWNLEKQLKFSTIKKNTFNIWKKKIKTIYYVRSKTISEKENNPCSSCTL